MRFLVQPIHEEIHTKLTDSEKPVNNRTVEFIVYSLQKTDVEEFNGGGLGRIFWYFR